MQSATIDQAPGGPTAEGHHTETPTRPRLLEGTELMGRFAGSGLREPPYLVRRSDGQVVQLSHLLYVIASCMDGRDLDAIARGATARLNVRIGPEHVAHVAEHKLAPLGLVAYQNGSIAPMERRNALLALRFRAAIVPEQATNALARPLTPLFRAPVVIAALGALVACDVWLATSHPVTAGLRTVIRYPVLGLAWFVLTVFSLALHECGHAAACRYGGARPGRIGIGIYLVWPVFYTDVTDSYRLSKAGRLRTDLGGVYFNALLALLAAGVYFATSYEPLLILVITQQLLILDQFTPWMRLDGYHIVSDLIGVSDLFARIKPVIRSLVPRRAADRRVTELKPWARVAVTSWVLITVVMLLNMAVFIVLDAPGFLSQAWQSLILQIDAVGSGARIGNVVEVLSGAIGVFMLVLPVAGITLIYLLLCRTLGASLAIREARRINLSLTTNGEEVPHPRARRFPISRTRTGNTCPSTPTPPEGASHA
jgi:putative peptide zinc metalloprotease protein